MARPRGNEWLKDEIVNIKKQNVDLLVSLLERDEILELGLQNEDAICKSTDIEFINFPIVDRNIPKAGDKIDWLINQLTAKIDSGLSIVIHCRMGIGRSAILAASILLQKGFKADDVIAEICKIRGLKVPDTDEQLKWLRSRQ
jgi:protein-tyrosine phosphatase